MFPLDEWESARRGDPEAFIALIERHKQSLYKVARGYFSENMDVEDVISETILTCWEHISQVKEPTALKAWLLRVLINKCNDQKRLQARLIPVEELPEAPAQDPDPGNLNFESLIACLDEATRPLMILYYGEGFKVREIAAMTGLPKGTVTSRLKRGRERLSAVLGGKECV